MVLISARNRSAPTTAARFRLEDLEGDFALVPQVLGQIDRSHGALAELTPYAVAALKSRVQADYGVRCGSGRTSNLYKNVIASRDGDHIRNDPVDLQRLLDIL